MLVVVVIGVMIVTKGQFLILFKQHELSVLFEPGKFKIDNAHFDAECSEQGGAYAYRKLNLYVEGFRFLDPGDEENPEVRVVLALNLGDRLITDRQNGGNIICRKPPGGKELECPKKVQITFDEFPIAFTPSASDLIHLTAWRYSAGVNDMLTRGATLSEMIEAEFQSYLGSIDAVGTIKDFQTACAASICLKCGAFCTRDACEQHNFCWYEPLVFELPGGACNVCAAESCSRLSERACSQCSTHCAWSITESKCKQKRTDIVLT